MATEGGLQGWRGIWGAGRQYKDLQAHSEGCRGEMGAGEWWDGVAASRRIRAPSESLRWGNKGTHRGGHSGALVRWIWGPQQKHQAESGDRGQGDVAVGPEAAPAFVFMCSVFMSGPHAGEKRSGGISCEGREVSWDVLCRGVV